MTTINLVQRSWTWVSLVLVTGILLLPACSENTSSHGTSNDSKNYESVENDPLNARIYTLKNGLKVYITVNEDEPRVQTFVAVRAGSKYDPADATGLAHYLEHMLFKGTSKLSTSDWAKEKPLLDQISDLYEQHRNTTDEAERAKIYAKIDSVSQEASKYAIANEYDKITSGMGARYTNAYTWVEQTVYMNEIPSNELEKWMMLESERFQELVLRLFHTELEAVYEEFNRGQDSDFRKMIKAMNEGLFQKHPYGTQTTIGEGEHLKNPSMVKIHEYFNTYYVPNNIAICLSGDLDPEKTVAMVEKYFGNWETKPVPEFKFEKEAPITQPIIKEVMGPQEEQVAIGYRFDGGAGSHDAMMVELIDMLLVNGSAGLMDLDLVQKQLVLQLSSSPEAMKDYTTLMFWAQPRGGQTLEEVKDLMLAEIEKVKAGEFDDWLIEASVNQLELRRIKEFERNYDRAHAFVETFVKYQDWSEEVNKFNEMRKVTKQEVVDYAKQHFGNNYVAVLKRNGNDPSLHKVEKPHITPLEVQRDKQSEFLTEFMKMSSQPLEPKFLDYEKDIEKHQLASGIPMQYIKNGMNETFQLYYILDMGSDNDLYLPLAIEYLPYLGTSKYPADKLQQEFYRLGLDFDVNSSRDRVYVSLEGLESSLAEGVELFEHILAEVQSNQEAYNNMVQGVIKERADARLDKSTILNRALYSYAVYGKDNPYTHRLSEAALKQADPNELVNRIKSIPSYKHRVFYFGAKSPQDVIAVLDAHHKPPTNLMDYPAVKQFAELPMDQKQVLFVDYDMVQAEVIMLAKSDQYHPEWTPDIELFNQYFGSGLSSIVFQEIREAKALAYSAYARFRIPSYNDRSHYISAYVGTQADKLKDALIAMNEIIADMPQAEEQFAAAKDAIIKKMQSERITNEDIFWDYERAKKHGLDHDIRKDVYAKVQQLTLQDIAKFQQDHVKGENYVYLVLGSKNKVDMKVLKNLGPVKTVPVDELFGFMEDGQMVGMK